MTHLLPSLMVKFALIFCCFYASAEIRQPEYLTGKISIPPLERSIEMLDTLDCLPLEGIWEYPGDEVKVLILRRDPATSDHYTISVLESFDCNLKQGDKLGWLSATVEKNRYELHQYTRRKKGLLDLPGKCHVKVSDNGRALLISEPAKLKISFNHSVLLPRFWRLVRVRTGKTQNEPSEGLRKIYPSDSQGTLFKGIRTL